jgi:hypothetical protein
LYKDLTNEKADECLKTLLSTRGPDGMSS